MPTSSATERAPLKSSGGGSPVSLIRAILEIFGIAFLRFRSVSRIWAVYLVAANALALLFLSRIEAVAVLAVIAAGVLYQGSVYQKRGFVRLLGSGHVLMIPMLVWFVFWRIDAVSLPEDRLFYNWLWLVIVTDTICVVVDIVEVTRYLKGDSEPSYIW